ncbi:hypothetical protein FB451DRAFT_1294028, partial [Mycena latifolia]
TWCTRCARSITCSLLQRDTAVRPSLSRNSSFIPMPLPAVSSLPSSSFCLLRLALPLVNLRFGGPVPHGRDVRVRLRRCAPRRSPHRQDTFWRMGLLSPSPSFFLSACSCLRPTRTGVAYVQSTGYSWLYSILVLPRSHPRRYDRSPRLSGTAHCA